MLVNLIINRRRECISDSEFPFACHGFVQINLARQSQEPKLVNNLLRYRYVPGTGTCYSTVVLSCSPSLLNIEV